MLRVAAREHGTRVRMATSRLVQNDSANKKTLAAKARGLSDKRSFDFAKTQK